MSKLLQNFSTLSITRLCSYINSAPYLFIHHFIHHGFTYKLHIHFFNTEFVSFHLLQITKFHSIRHTWRHLSSILLFFTLKFILSILHIFFTSLKVYRPSPTIIFTFSCKSSPLKQILKNLNELTTLHFFHVNFQLPSFPYTNSQLFY